MSKDYRLECSICHHEWIGTPYDEQYEERCPECQSDEFEIGNRYMPISIRDCFWIVLLIPNILLFGGAL